jgi:bifunctional DNA-binding transcriptional regulator/antitoxin component of YhaV-PrlF toxin-antitoxin module
MFIIKKLDKQGRLVIPKKWRKDHLKENTVIMRIEDDRIIIEDYKPVDITEFFDSIELELESDIEDWDAVKGELLAPRRR